MEENYGKHDQVSVPHMNATRGPSDKVAKGYRFGVSLALVAVVSFMLGVFFAELKASDNGVSQVGTVLNRDATPAPGAEDVDFAHFWQVWEMIKDKYVSQPISDIDLYYGSITGMVAALEDPYSVFLDPEFAEEFALELSGSFEGIGAEIGIKKNQLTVIAPLPDTPAERAGLKAGDSILAIDEVDTFGMVIEEAVQRIRGPKGTEVVLLIYREGAEETQDISIIRDTIVIESVKWETRRSGEKDVGIITISHFNENTEGLFSEAVQDMILEDPDHLILDLRNNPGGFLDTAVTVAGEWVSSDVIVVEEFSDGSDHKYRSNGSARFADLPTIVLVNGGSASASEIVAGALQDHGKAIVIGETTFGKGSVQDYVEFLDKSALKLTIALWMTPNGRMIDKEGIAPDETVELTFEDFENDRDPQMDRALELVGSYEDGQYALDTEEPVL
jgi:carboxyl-terminal processing protease